MRMTMNSFIAPGESGWNDSEMKTKIEGVEQFLWGGRGFPNMDEIQVRKWGGTQQKKTGQRFYMYAE